MPRPRKSKKEKDPNKPKRGLTAYILFGKDERLKIKESNPDMDRKDVMSELGKRWREASESVRAKYEELAKEDSERYRREMEDYTPPVREDCEDNEDNEERVEKEGKGKEKGKKGKRVKKEKDPNAPKRGVNAYMFYLKDNRASVKDANPGAKASDITKKVSEQWRGESEKVRSKYEALAKEDSERYHREMKAYKESASSSSSSQVEENNEENAEDSLSGFDLFCYRTRTSVKEENSKLSPKQVSRVLKKMWKELSDSERDEYN